MGRRREIVATPPASPLARPLLIAMSAVLVLVLGLIGVAAVILMILAGRQVTPARLAAEEHDPDIRFIR